jgi:hypothetical protein
VNSRREKWRTSVATLVAASNVGRNSKGVKGKQKDPSSLTILAAQKLASSIDFYFFPVSQ